MGGPEAGRFHTPLVQLRQRCKQALAPLRVAGVASCEMTVWISGSVSDYTRGAASRAMKYFARDERLLVSVVVDPEAAKNVADGDEAHALAAWIAAGFDEAHRPRSARQLDLDALAAALGSTPSPQSLP